MAVKNSYSKAKATKSTTQLNINKSLTTKQKKQAITSVKKSPLLFVAMLFMVIGLIGGFYVFNILSPFKMKAFYVNGVQSEHSDFVVIDMSSLKQEYDVLNPSSSLEEFYESINLKDDFVECKFFNMDIKDSVTSQIFYREDISKDIQQVSAIDVTIPGVYYIEYVSNHFAFKNSTLIRTIIITGVENDG